MRERKLKWSGIKQDDVLFVITFLIYVVNQVVYSSQPGYFLLPKSIRFPIFVIVFSVPLIGLLIRNRMNNLFAMLLLAFLLAVTILGSGDVRRILIFLSLMVAAEHLDFDRFFTYLFWCFTILLVGIICLDQCGAFVNLTNLLENVDRGDGTIRQFLGFIYPTYAPNYYLTMVLLWCYKERKQVFSLWRTALILIANYLLYQWTDTRAVYYLVIMLVAAFIVIKLSKIQLLRSRLIQYLCYWIFPISTAVCLWLGVVYDPTVDWMLKLNSVLSGRLRLTRAAIDEFGIRLTGSRFTFRTMGYYNTDDYLFVDCSYWNILIRHGIIALIFILLLLLIVTHKAIREKDQILILILGVIAIHSCTDPQLFDLIYTPFLLMASDEIRCIIKQCGLTSVCLLRRRDRKTGAYR